MSAVTSSALGSLSSDAFLKLFVTQLKYQDPTQPMDPSAMMAQLAQLSTVQKLDELNTNFQVALRTEKLSFARELIGMQITYGVGNESFIGLVEGAALDNGLVGLLINGGFVPIDELNGILGGSAS